MTETMQHNRPRPDPEYRLVSLDPRDIEDLARLLGKLGRGGPASGADGVAGSGEADNDPATFTRRAQKIFDDRRRRSAIFGPQMFAEPAWEMLLILYLSAAGQRQTQTSLGKLSGASRSTAMRWIDYLESQGLVRRDEHPTDKRSNFVSLSDKGRQSLELYLSGTG